MRRVLITLAALALAALAVPAARAHHERGPGIATATACPTAGSANTICRSGSTRPSRDPDHDGLEQPGRVRARDGSA